MDFSKCKYCGSRTDVFYMFGEPVCYDCAIELLNENEDVKIEKRNGEYVFYIKKAFSKEEVYEEVECIYEACLLIKTNEEYRKDYYWEDECRIIRSEYSFRDIRCEEKVNHPFFRNYKWSCFNDAYNLYLFTDDETGDVITICDDCFLKRIGIEKVLVGLKYTYSEEYFYIYYCEGKPISAIRHDSPIWEKEGQVAKVIDYCIDNFELQLELVEGVEYTDKYYKALKYNHLAKEHQFYKVLSYKKLEKLYSAEIKSKSKKRKELIEIKEFVRKSLNLK